MQYLWMALALRLSIFNKVCPALSLSYPSAACMFVGRISRFLVVAGLWWHCLRREVLLTVYVFVSPLLGKFRPDTVVVHLLLRFSIVFIIVVHAVRVFVCSLFGSRVGVLLDLVSWIQQHVSLHH
jgi:membrane protein YqaA with SNARE-associated domain